MWQDECKDLLFSPAAKEGNFLHQWQTYRATDVLLTLGAHNCCTCTVNGRVTLCKA